MTLNCGNYGLFLIMGHAGFISSIVVRYMLPATSPIVKLNEDPQYSRTLVDSVAKVHIAWGSGVPDVGESRRTQRITSLGRCS